MRRYSFPTLTLAAALLLGCGGDDAGVDSGEETGVVGSDSALREEDAEAEQVEADVDDRANDPLANPAVEEEPATELPATGKEASKQP